MVIAATTSGRAAPKLASIVAHRIEDEIVAADWPIGRVIGSEAELMQRFGISRAILREAVRIVEHDGAAVMRRGPGGGLVVARPDPTAVAWAAAIWFGYMGVTIGELFDARTPLLMQAVRLASERIDEFGVARLRGLLIELESRDVLESTDYSDIEQLIAEIAENPAIELFLAVINEVLLRLVRGSRAFVDPVGPEDNRRHLQAYADLIDAVVRGNAGQAEFRVEAIWRAAKRRLHDRSVRPRRRPSTLPAGHGKLAERVAAAIQDEIERAGWPVGQLIGNEPELVNRFGVSRAIFREAIRILEHHNAVRTKRGPGGGVVVDEPDGGSVERAAELVLKFQGVTLEQLLEARAALEIAAVQLAAERCTAETADDLRAALAAEGQDSDVDSFHEVHRHLAAASGSRPVQLFVDVLADVTSSYVPPRELTDQENEQIWEDVRRAHAMTVEAVIAGDVPLAQRRMIRHLEATFAWLR
ncbi:MAG: FadR/GntR family transcriptional regulator [Acidimicrobiales bacterium]